MLVDGRTMQNSRRKINQSPYANSRRPNTQYRRVMTRAAQARGLPSQMKVL
jgi:hypothetical protein